MRIKSKFTSFMYFLLVSVPLVKAQPFNMQGDLSFIIDQIFTTLLNLFRRQNVVAGITVVAFFIILYAIYSGALKRLKLFKGEKGLSNGGILASVGFSLLSTIGIFFRYGSSLDQIILRVHQTMGSLGIILIGIVVFFMVYLSSKQKEGRDTCLALLSAGLVIYLIGYVAMIGFWQVIGGLITFLGIICYLRKKTNLLNKVNMGGLFGSKGPSTGKTSYDDDSARTTDTPSSEHSTGDGSESDDDDSARTTDTPSSESSTSDTDTSIRGSSPTDGYTDVVVRVIDQEGKDVQGAIVELLDKGKINKIIKRKWTQVGETARDGKVKFRTEIGFTWIKATKGNTNIRKVYIEPGVEITIQLGSISVKITYDYGAGETSRLVSGQENVVIKIKSMKKNIVSSRPHFTSPLNKYILYYKEGNKTEFNLNNGLLKTVSRTEYRIDIDNTGKCTHCRYFFG